MATQRDERQVKPILYIFSGLPGSGKSTLAKKLARQTGAVYLRIDTVEQAMRDFCSIPVREEGYLLAYRVAADNLALGQDVIADCCNPIALTRDAWEAVAQESGADYVNVEVVCTDEAEHRRRVESRSPEVAGLRLPSWQEVVDRTYHTWRRERIVVDTAHRSAGEVFQAMVEQLDGYRASLE